MECPCASSPPIKFINMSIDEKIEEIMKPMPILKPEDANKYKKS